MVEQEQDCMLTTFDNKFNPFTEFEAWFKEDLRLGHNTCGLLAKTSNTSDVASDEVNEEDIDRAMNEIVAREPLIYKKVKKEDFKNVEKIKNLEKKEF